MPKLTVRSTHKGAHTLHPAFVNLIKAARETPTSPASFNSTMNRLLNNYQARILTTNAQITEIEFMDEDTLTQFVLTWS